MTSHEGAKDLLNTRNRRQVERKYLVFYLRVYDGMSSKVLGHVVNISSRGVMLLSDQVTPINEEYRLRMKLPAEVAERGEIVFNAISRWCRPDANPDFYLTGFQIEELGAVVKDDILSLINEFSFEE